MSINASSLPHAMYVPQFEKLSDRTGVSSEPIAHKQMSSSSIHKLTNASALPHAIKLPCCAIHYIIVTH
jgi:hypothetical protein